MRTIRKHAPAARLLGIALALGAAAGCQTSHHEGSAAVSGERLRMLTSEDPESMQPKAQTAKVVTQALKSAGRDEWNGGDPADLARMAHLYLLKGNLKQASAAASKALAIDFRNREAKLVMAYVAYRQQRYAFASGVLKTLGGERAPEAEVLNLMSLVAAKQNDEAEALRLAEAAAAKGPTAVAPRLNAAILHLRQHEYDAAERLLRDAQRLDKDNLDVKLHLAVVCAVLGRGAEAERLYQSVRDAAGDAGVVMFNQAAMYARAHKVDAAIKAYQAYAQRMAKEPSRADEAKAAIADLKLERASKGGVSDERINALAEDAGDGTGDEALAFDEDQTPRMSSAATSMGVVDP